MAKRQRHYYACVITRFSAGTDFEENLACGVRFTGSRDLCDFIRSYDDVINFFLCPSLEAAYTLAASYNERFAAEKLARMEKEA